MSPKDRAVFIAAYSRLVAEVWADPAKERELERDPRALLASYGLPVPAEVAIEVVRHIGDAEPDLEAQVRLWADAETDGRLVLIVPSVDPVSAADLVEHELDAVVAGLDSGCACCCPCCCTT